MKRTPLRPMSKKRQRESKEYTCLRKEFLGVRHFCEAHHMVFPADGLEFACDIHHVEGRGKNYLRTETWLPVCRDCHRWIHDHGDPAREMGLLK